ncbi:hypothetical protein OG948_52245 (plasmid) [Embleya sp. NBC_00888]|uniref:hypothetical protein n=1 Tax=Embleya sp. NBC_00888 TaxID=2975960 RepID=UPI00386E2FFA|nr:hypothetical protein OG948_52245 [Embleya sp. NBC_00888]
MSAHEPAAAEAVPDVTVRVLAAVTAAIAIAANLAAVRVRDMEGPFDKAPNEPAHAGVPEQ